MRHQGRSLNTFWTDLIRSLRYFGSAAHEGEPYSSTHLMALKYTETRLAKESALFLSILRPYNLNFNSFDIQIFAVGIPTQVA